MRTGARVLFLCGVLLVTTGALAAAGNSLATLSTRIAYAIGAQAPEWTPADSNVEGNRLEQSWSHGLERLRIRCVEYQSIAAASQALSGVMLEAAGGQAVAEIGDAARIWPRWSAGGDTTIYVRRATFMCDTVAPSPTLSRRFAGLVVTEIDGLLGRKAPVETASAVEYQVAIVLVGIDPFSIDVPVGSRVAFINKDPHFAHDMTSSCPEIDAVGRLGPGQSGRTTVFTSAKICTYYDRLHPDTPLRRGTIVVR